MRLASIYATDPARSRAIHLAGPGQYSQMEERFKELRSADPADPSLPLLVLVDVARGASRVQRYQPPAPLAEVGAGDVSPAPKPPRRRNPGDGQA